METNKMVNDRDKKLVELSELLHVDISEFIWDGYFIGMDGYTNAIRKIAKSFENDDKLYDITDGTKFENSRLESDIVSWIIHEK